ncbi:MAG: EF-hand domain-containing protein [Burkholderiaceae bacterium]
MQTLFRLFRLLPALALCCTGAGVWADPGVQPSAAAPAASAPASSATPSRGELKALRQFQMLDANGDGKLSRAEVALFPPLSAAFDEADSNHDGFVTPDEIRVFSAHYRAERERAKAAKKAQEQAQQQAASPDGAH